MMRIVATSMTTITTSGGRGATSVAAAKWRAVRSTSVPSRHPSPPRTRGVASRRQRALAVPAPLLLSRDRGDHPHRDAVAVGPVRATRIKACVLRHAAVWLAAAAAVPGGLQAQPGAALLQ